MLRAPISGQGALDVETPSRVATFAAGLGMAGGLAFALGPLAIQFRAASPFVGFRIFGLGLLLGLLAVIFGCFGLWRTRAAAHRAGRGRAVLGTGIGAVMVGVTFLGAGSGLSGPPINDITTNLDDPPVFVAAQEFEANRGRDFTHAGEELARQQRAGYPDLAPIQVDRSPDAVWERAITVAEDLGWEIVARNRSAGFEAVLVTRIFQFVDDIVVRIRPAGAGSSVDVRSKSRDGKGDVGANAARIRAFRDALTH